MNLVSVYVLFLHISNQVLAHFLTLCCAFPCFVTTLHSNILETACEVSEECLGFHVFVFLDFSWGKANKRTLLILLVVLRVSPVLHSKGAYSVLRVLGVCKGLVILALVYMFFWYALCQWDVWNDVDDFLSRWYRVHPLDSGEVTCACARKIKCKQSVQEKLFYTATTGHEPCEGSLRENKIWVIVKWENQ